MTIEAGPSEEEEVPQRRQRERVPTFPSSKAFK